MNLTEKLVEAVKDCFSERGIALHVSTNDLTEAIRSVLGQEWVSVGVKRPEYGISVIVYDKVFGVKTSHLSMIGGKGKLHEYFWIDESATPAGKTAVYLDVTHWQPLPTPPTT